MNNIVVAIIAIFASTGFWQFIMMLWQSKKKNQSALERAVIAMLHDKLYERAERYISRGGITVQELDNLKYIYEPYAEMGGNGTGKTLYNHCVNLPIISEEFTHEEVVK